MILKYCQFVIVIIAPALTCCVCVIIRDISHAQKACGTDTDSAREKTSMVQQIGWLFVVWQVFQMINYI